MKDNNQLKNQPIYLNKEIKKEIKKKNKLMKNKKYQNLPINKLNILQVLILIKHLLKMN